MYSIQGLKNLRNICGWFYLYIFKSSLELIYKIFIFNFPLSIDVIFKNAWNCQYLWKEQVFLICICKYIL